MSLSYERMLNLQFHNQSQSIRTLSPLPNPFLHGNGPAFRPAQLRPSFKKAPKIGVGFSPSINSIKAIFNLTAEKSTKVKAVITVKPIVSDPLAVEKLIGTLVLELVSAELDPGKCIGVFHFKEKSHTHTHTYIYMPFLSQ